MFCPQCRMEYRPGFTRCSDCDIPLVDHLAADLVSPGDTADSAYVAVATAQGQLDADQMCSFLEGNGIPAVIQGEALRNVYGIQITGIATLQILVPEELASTARDLLRKADRGELAIDAEDGEISDI